MSAGSLPWRPNLKAQGEALARKLADQPLEAFSQALANEAESRLEEFAKGVRAYDAFQRTPRTSISEVIWQDGSTRLSRYHAKKKASKRSLGAPVLVVPSLINRAYILDLAPDKSFMQSLADQGLDPYLIDWGEPSGPEKDFGLTDYIAGRLEAALDHISETRACRAGVVGYCMGGLLALALAQRKPKQISALALLATPWDFHRPTDAHGQMMRAMRPQIEQTIALHQGLPVDILQAMFASIAPFQTIEKFRAFGRLAAKNPKSEKAKLFVALEDWLNDGVPLSAKVAEECLLGWYGQNTTARGVWRVAGRPVHPDEIAQPALVVIPTGDKIVPPESAAALPFLMDNFERWDIKAGHIGMVAGNGAKTRLYEPLGAWLTSHV